MAKQWTPEERKAFADKMAASRAAKNSQTNTPKEPIAQKENIATKDEIPDGGVAAGDAGSITLTQQQFDTLIKRLDAGSTSDKSPAPSMSGMQQNPFGQVVGTMTKFNVDPTYYPDPTEQLLEDFDNDVRMRRWNLRENYFFIWDITAKPYQTKDNLSVQEPTFHMTLYANEYDDQGEATDRAYVIQALHMNEDEELTRMFAAENDILVTEEGLRELMDRTRYDRIRRWVVDNFYPPRNFDMNVESREEAIGGTVVKVVTKSNVKGFGNPTPKISDEELS